MLPGARLNISAAAAAARGGFGMGDGESGVDGRARTAGGKRWQIEYLQL
jgi:hypothetical protein